MLQLVLAAPRSGSGKTTAACALLAALTARGLTPCAFKSGPDYIDGLGGVTDTASAWQLADTLDLPALLVVRPKGASLTLAAELRGLTAFRTPHHIAGILLNDCTQG